MEEEEDPYKFEEEELDRAREEAKKLEVERQRKASVSSSGVSDRSPLPSLENSPAAFSEGERSPAINSPVAFGGKQFSPVPDKSPNIPSYSPRYETTLGKSYNSYDSDKSKYQTNGTLKVGFYKDHSDKCSQDKQDGKSSEHKPTESPLYSPTVPYVSNFYSKSESTHKQKSPGRYNNFYPPSIDPGVDKPKTPSYYPSPAPSTPSDKPSPSTHTPDADKNKPPFNYYNYDPNKPLTDQFKNTGSSQTTSSQNTASSSTPNRGGQEHTVVSPHAEPPHVTSTQNSHHTTVNTSTPPSRSSAVLSSSSRHHKPSSYYGSQDNSLSPAGPSPGSVSLNLASPNQMQMPTSHHHHHHHQAPPTHQDNKPMDLPPPKKRPGLDRVLDEPSLPNRNLGIRAPLDVSLFSQHPPANLPANLANLSQIVSRFPEPDSGGLSHVDKDRMVSSHEMHHERNAPSCPPVHEKALHSPVYGTGDSPAILGMSDYHQSNILSGRRSQLDFTKSRQEIDSQVSDRPSSIAYHQVASSLMPPSQSSLGPSSNSLSKLHQQSQLPSHGYSLTSAQPPPPAAHQKSQEPDRPGSRSVPPPPDAEKAHHYLPPKAMWTSSSLASSLPVSLASFNSAAMAQFALAGQKGLSSLPSDRLAQLSMASLANRSANTNIFPHDLLGRGSSHQPQSQMSSGSNSSGSGSSSSHHSSGNNSNGGSVGRSSVGGGNSGGSGSSMDLSLARSYASLMSGGQSSPLFGRGEGALTPGTLPRTLPGSTSPFLPQSPGLSSSLSMPGAPRTPTPAHQQPHQSLSLSQSNFAGTLPRDPISQSHPSLQIPSLNSIVSSQPQISHLNAAAGLASYHNRDSLALMGQGSRGAALAAGGLVDQAASQQLYEQYIQRQQQEFLLRSASHPQLAAQHSMMIQQGFMSAAAGYPSGYPASLGLRSGSYQGMNRPWL